MVTGHTYSSVTGLLLILASIMWYSLNQGENRKYQEPAAKNLLIFQLKLTAFFSRSPINKAKGACLRQLYTVGLSAEAPTGFKFLAGIYFKKQNRALILKF